MGNMAESVSEPCRQQIDLHPKPPFIHFFLGTRGLEGRSGRSGKPDVSVLLIQR